MKVTEKQTEQLFLLSITLIGAIALFCLAIDPLLKKPKPKIGQGLSHTTSGDATQADLDRLARN